MVFISSTVESEYLFALAISACQYYCNVNRGF